jgi:hypothetical protein
MMLPEGITPKIACTCCPEMGATLRRFGIGYYIHFKAQGGEPAMETKIASTEDRAWELAVELLESRRTPHNSTSARWHHAHIEASNGEAVSRG